MTPQTDTTVTPAPQGRHNALVMSVAVALGLLAGISVFTFSYGDGAAYLSNDPNACINCHVMQDHFDSWMNSSHRHVAVCNDCHLPPDFAGKWITKADNGLLHSVAFTTGSFRDPIQIKPRNAQRTQDACLKCHGEFVEPLVHPQMGDSPLSCVHCHTDAGHALR